MSERSAKLKRLREIRDEAKSLGATTVELDGRIRDLNQPDIGEVLYLAPGKVNPVQIISRMGQSVSYIPADTAIGSTHQGNLYDEDGDEPYGH